MKRYILIFILILVIPMFGNVRKWEDMLLNDNGVATYIDIAAGATATDGTDFTSLELPVEHSIRGTIAVIFTTAGGTASTIDVDLWVSIDHKEYWCTYRSGGGANPMVQVASNAPKVSGNIVAMAYQLNLSGISHIVIRSIKNNDATGITDVQVRISM